MKSHNHPISKMPSSRDRGFTLVELLVVIAISIANCTGCGDTPSHISTIAWDADKLVDQTLADLDKDGEGQLSMAELETATSVFLLRGRLWASNLSGLINSSDSAPLIDLPSDAEGSLPSRLKSGGVEVFAHNVLYRYLDVTGEVPEQFDE